MFFYLIKPSTLFRNKYSTVIYDRHHELLSARIADDGQWRFPPDTLIAPKFEKCLLEFEDQYFYRHPGINIFSLGKAFYRNMTTTKKKIGGSTITMQLIRISRENRTRTYIEKCIEIILALRLELALSKKEILNYYAHNAPFGGNVVGVEAASWRYFGRASNQLSWAESAMLAVLPNAPSLIYPGKNHEILLRKRNKLLKKIFHKKLIDKNTYQLALQEAIPEKPHQLPQLAPHLLQRIISENKQGKIYHTTVEKNIQLNTIHLLNKHLEQHKSNQIKNAAALIINTYTGEIISYVGNSNSLHKEDQNDVDIIGAARSSGSLLKPLLYALLMSEGKLTPDAFVEDVPTQIGAYAPKNYNLSYDGMVHASEAVTRSLNVPAVKMLQQYGTAPFLFQLKKLGFESLDKAATHYGLSLILGGGEVTPWDVASVYSSMGRVLDNYNRFEAYSQNSISKIHYFNHKKSNVTWSAQPAILSAGSIWYTFNAMNELARPEDYSKSNFFSSISKIAWKTGTSFGFRDAWAVGVNKNYTIVVWVGNADGEGRPGLTGINVAAPLMFSLFNSLPSATWYSKPVSDLIKTKICNETGNIATNACFQASFKYIPKSKQHTSVCTYHKLINLDASGRFQVNSKCYKVMQMQKKSFLMLSPIQEFFYRKKHLDYIGAPPFMEDCSDDLQTNNFDLIYPRNGFKIYLPLNENSLKNDLILNATCNNNNASLFWYLDQRYLGATKRYHQMAVQPVLGKHQLLIMDEKGKSLSAQFEIVDKKK